jgi:hypothetical protein
MCIAVDIIDFRNKRTGRFKTMLQQADEEQLDALDGRRKIKGLCETRWSSREDALNIFKSAHALIIDDLGTGGDRNAKQLKLALQDFGFMVALVATECVLQYSLALSNLLQRPSIDLVEAASEAETVNSSLRKIRQGDNVWQELYLCAVAYQLSSVCSVIHSAFRQDLLCPGITLARHCHPV